MSSNNRHAPFPVTRIAIMAVFSLLLMLGAAALLIFALFYNDLPGNVMKVQAGDLDIHATYVRIEGTKIDTDASSPYYGRFITFAEDKNKDLSTEEESLFAVECAAPTMTQTATFTAKNEGNLAFNCEIRICDLILNGPDAAANEALSNQMLIRIECGTESVEFRLCAYEAAESALTIRELAPGATSTFTVTATFLDDAAFLNDNDHTNDFKNLDAVNGALDFDITLIATQTFDIAYAD